MDSRNNINLFWLLLLIFRQNVLHEMKTWSWIASLDWFIQLNDFLISPNIQFNIYFMFIIQLYTKFMSDDTDVLQQFLNINKIFSENSSYCIMICDEKLYHCQAQIVGHWPNSHDLLMLKLTFERLISSVLFIWTN